MKGTLAYARVGAWVVFTVLTAMAAPLPAQRAKRAKLDVPYVPTQRQAVAEMLNLAKVTSEDYVIDLGCGDGRIVIAAAKDHKARGLGVDLDPRRIRQSNRNAKKAGVTDRVEFRQADVMKTDVRKASVVTLFLLEDINVRLRPKLFAELKPGTRVVSNSFSMRDWKPDREVRHSKAYTKVIYFWRMPAPVAGTWAWKSGPKGEATSGTLRLQQEFQAVRGTVSLPDAPDVRITDAKLLGKELSFNAALQARKQPISVSFRGTAEGDEIRGTQQWSAGPLSGTHPWVAKRKPANTTGRWQVRVPVKPELNGTLRIERTLGELKAFYTRDGDGEKEQPLPAFYAWGDSVRFEVPNDGLYPMAFRGTLTDEGAGGTLGAEPSMEGPLTWTARRVAGE